MFHLIPTPVGAHTDGVAAGIQNKNDKIFPIQATKPRGDSGCVAPSTFNLDAWRSASSPDFCCPLNRRLGGLQSRSGVFGQQTNQCHCRHRTKDRPDCGLVRIQNLWRKGTPSSILILVDTQRNKIIKSVLVSWRNVTWRQEESQLPKGRCLKCTCITPGKRQGPT